MINLHVEDLDKNPHLIDPSKTHSFRLIWRGQHANPNGDPAMPSGEPRTDAEDRALVSDVCVKRMMKDVLEDVFECNLYLSRKAAMKGATGRSQAQAVANRDEAIAAYYDVRMFGAVFNKGEGSGGADQILGPVQVGISTGTSFDGGPVEQHELQITRLMDQKSAGATGMGRKTVIDNVELVTKGRYSGYLGERNGVTAEDMKKLWFALANCIGHRPSSSRGFCWPVSLQIVTYDNEYGGRNNIAHTTAFDLEFDEWAERDAS